MDSDLINDDHSRASFWLNRTLNQSTPYKYRRTLGGKRPYLLFHAIFRPKSVTLPKRKWLYHGTPDWVRAENERFFITLCCKQRGRAQLTVPTVAEGILNSINFGQQRGDWYVRLILLMPDHLHMIASFPDHAASMTKVLSDWKRLIARRHQIEWQKAFFDHRLRNDAALDEKAAYIRLNPVRAGLCDQPEDWPYIWEPEV